MGVAELQELPPARPVAGSSGVGEGDGEVLEVPA